MPTFRLKGADGREYDVDDVSREAAQAQLDAAVKAPTPKPVPGVVSDVLQSGAAGLRRGVESIFGTPDDLVNLAGKGVGWATGTEQDWGIPYLPSSEQIHEATSEAIGPSYTPQTDLGRFAGTAMEFAPGFIGGGGLAKNAIKFGLGAGAGLASEGAGQLTEGTVLEGPARAVTGLVAGAGAEAAGAGAKHIKTAPGRAAEAAAEDAAAKHGVRLTKGERTGDVTQQMQEQQMLHGARGPWAQRLMEARRRENVEGIKDASAKLRDTMAPTRGATPIDSAAQLQESVRTRAEGAMDRGGAKIDRAGKAGVMINADRLRGLDAELAGKLEGNVPHVPDVVLGPETTAANSAMDRIRRFMSQAEDPNVKEFSLAGAEALRRQINSLVADPRTEDARALGKIQRYLDEWYDDVIGNDSNLSMPANTLPGNAPTPDTVYAELREGRSDYREGARIVKPRGNEKRQPGAKSLSKVATDALPEDTARKLKPIDRGDMPVGAMELVNRLKSTGGTPHELSQVRDIVLDQLMTGDPGKVATRIDNFIRNNPTGAKALFSDSELAELSAYGSTNKRLVPDPKAANPSKSSYGIISELTKRAAGQMGGSGGIIGAILGGPVGAVAGATLGAGAEALSQGRSFLKARSALKPADRSTLSETMIKGGRTGLRKAAPGAVQGAQTLTITDEADPDFGTQVRVISEGKDGYEVELPNGKRKRLGKALVK